MARTYKKRPKKMSKKSHKKMSKKMSKKMHRYRRKITGGMRVVNITDPGRVDWIGDQKDLDNKAIIIRKFAVRHAENLPPKLQRSENTEGLINYINHYFIAQLKLSSIDEELEDIIKQINRFWEDLQRELTIIYTPIGKLNTRIHDTMTKLHNSLGTIKASMSQLTGYNLLLPDETIRQIKEINEFLSDYTTSAPIVIPLGKV